MGPSSVQCPSRDESLQVVHDPRCVAEPKPGVRETLLSMAGPGTQAHGKAEGCLGLGQGSETQVPPWLPRGLFALVQKVYQEIPQSSESLYFYTFL